HLRAQTLYALPHDRLRVVGGCLHKPDYVLCEPLRCPHGGLSIMGAAAAGLRPDGLSTDEFASRIAAFTASAPVGTRPACTLRPPPASPDADRPGLAFPGLLPCCNHKPSPTADRCRP